MKYKCLEKLGLVKEDKKSRGGKIIRFVNKTLMAIFLALVALIVMEYSPKFKSFMQKDVLGKNISFGFFSNLYNKYFGEVGPISNEKEIAVFNEKITYTKKVPMQDGYLLSVDNNYLVPSINSGVVVFIGDKDNLGKVLVIEQEDGLTVTYGMLKNTDLKLYDYVNKGKFLGEVLTNSLYLAIQEKGEYQDIETYLS